MENRADLMRLIFDLDTELSSARSSISPTQKRNVLARCADVLDRAGNDDEFVVCQAIHLLIRKHDLEPEHYWPDCRSDPDPVKPRQESGNAAAGGVEIVSEG